MKNLLLASSLLLIGAAPNWTTTVTPAAGGAYVLGNPKAKVRVTEYLSFTCSHCAHFVEESSKPLKSGYILKGTVGLELRNAVRDQYDFAAALLSRCGPPSRIFANSEAIMLAQAQWMGKIEAFAKANSSRLAKLPINAQLIATAEGVGLTAIMQKRGYTQPQMRACLTSKPAQDQILAMTDEAWNKRKISGTPSFLINGTAIAGHHWAIVEPSIKAALAAL